MAYFLANKHAWIWIWLASFAVESSARRCSLCIPGQNDIDSLCNNHQEFVNCVNATDHCAVTIKFPNVGDGAPVVTRHCTGQVLTPVPSSHASLYYCQNVHSFNETMVTCLCESDGCNVHSRRRMLSILNKRISFLEHPDYTWYPFSTSSMIRWKSKVQTKVHFSDQARESANRSGILSCYTCSDRNCPQHRRSASEARRASDAAHGSCYMCAWQVSLPKAENTQRTCIDSQADTSGMGAAPYMCRRVEEYIWDENDFVPVNFIITRPRSYQEKLMCRCSDSNLCNYHATDVMYSELRSIISGKPFGQWFPYTPSDKTTTTRPSTTATTIMTTTTASTTMTTSAPPTVTATGANTTQNTTMSGC